MLENGNHASNCALRDADRSDGTAAGQGRRGGETGRERGRRGKGEQAAGAGASEEDGTGLVAALGGRSERRGEGRGGDW